MNKKIKVSLFLLAATLLLPIKAWAADFNAGYVISDYDMQDYTSMSLSKIQKFLETQGSTLVKMSFMDFYDITRTAAEIIYNAAYNNRISPKVLITTLQKEQSLIEDQTPTAGQYRWATGYGVCDNCDVFDPRVALFGGFGNQVELTAKIMRKYFDKPNLYDFKVGKTYNIDGTMVTIKNQATANLYIYTPHIHGNYNFWKIWTRYFKRTYPDGSLLATKENPDKIYLIQEGLRRLFLTKSAFISRFDAKKILYVPQDELDLFDDGQPIKYAQYSLVKSAQNSVTYLIVGDYKRPIENEKVFKYLGFNPEEVITAQNNDLDYYLDGTPITMSSSFPVGTVLQNKTSKALYYVEAGLKSKIINQEILNLKFKNKKIVKVSASELERYFDGGTVKLNDGELVKIKTNSAIYVISNGCKRLIPSRTVFDKMGYNMKNVITILPETLKIHPDGAPIVLEAEASIENGDSTSAGSAAITPTSTQSNLATTTATSTLN